MAMTFSSEGCRGAAADLNKSANTLDDLLDKIVEAQKNVKDVYNSETAKELYEQFNKLAGKLLGFNDSVRECSKYLTNKVAPAYERLESTALSKIR